MCTSKAIFSDSQFWKKSGWGIRKLIDRAFWAGKSRSGRGEAIRTAQKSKSLPTLPGCPRCLLTGNVAKRDSIGHVGIGLPIQFHIGENQVVDALAVLPGT